MWAVIHTQYNLHALQLLMRRRAIRATALGFNTAQKTSDLVRTFSSADTDTETEIDQITHKRYYRRGNKGLSSSYYVTCYLKTKPPDA